MAILAGNWKMHKTREELQLFADELPEAIKNSNQTCIIAPSPPLLETAVRVFKGTSVDIYSQNCSDSDWGAKTGEISPLQLKDLGVEGTIVGHSERRAFFGESNESAALRAIHALKSRLNVIFCVGESLEDRDAGNTEDRLKSQLDPLITNFEGELEALILAYEPVWAIGTGKTASPEQAQEVHSFLREWLPEAFKTRPILYGGSIKPNNFKELMAQPDIHGGLVGGASLEAESFAQLHDCLT